MQHKRNNRYSPTVEKKRLTFIRIPWAVAIIGWPRGPVFVRPRRVFHVGWSAREVSGRALQQLARRGAEPKSHPTATGVRLW